MQFHFSSKNWSDIKKGQENCFLLTNSLGGYCSLSMIGSNDRNDQALLMAAMVSPNIRYHMVTNTKETIRVEKEEYGLWSQEYDNGDEIACHEGYNYLQSFSYESLPQWTYQVPGATVVKKIVMVQGENTVGIRYQVHKKTEGTICLEVTPLLQLVLKGKMPDKNQKYLLRENYVESNGVRLYFDTNGKVDGYKAKWEDILYYEKDKRDGREEWGRCAHAFSVSFPVTKEKEEFYLIFSTGEKERDINQMIEREEAFAKELRAKAGLRDEVGKCLAESAYRYICDKESTKGRTILAGFPFFGDWGRDTMIALPGCAIATGALEDAKGILRTFMSYCKKGLMPNLFPEGTNDALYNTVDAALLFVQAVYEYYKKSEDSDFVKEAMPVIEEILSWYQKGTDYHIKMDRDGLIQAGKDLEQVTWMDVRFGDILPTPRHGKPVEINAYWYNALCIADEFRTRILGEKAAYSHLIELVKESFINRFWMEDKGYLRDVISMDEDNVKALEEYRKQEGRAGKELPVVEEVDEQIRCNQVWALSLPYSMLNEEQAERVLQVIEEHLLTPVGLRSLSLWDKDYHPAYEGGQDKRDMAYHQGTVWPYPMGAYYLAYLKWAKDKRQAIRYVKEKLEELKPYLGEGCLGHIAEVYDATAPKVSKGCFAQAWSVGELLRVYCKVEELEKEFLWNEYCYEGNDLGATYTKEKTQFKVWAPLADEVILNLYQSGGELKEDGLGTYPMERKGNGLWEYTLWQDAAGIYYTYSISHGSEVTETADIYAKGCGINGLRSMVVDLDGTNPIGWEEDRRIQDEHGYGTIYELHIKDFSHDEKSGMEQAYRGKYLAFTKQDTTLEQKGEFPTGITYLKDLGVSYVHLLPFHDFGSVEEDTKKEDGFNWGYDPINYMVPEGSYATNPYLGEVRIREVKEMVKALHDAGIGVIMDVVFNHTYYLDSYFQKTVPGYYYRRDEKGNYTNGSGCGNDTASERKMYRKYMQDAICYWAEEYHLDGFRFDLMGLHDVETMNGIRNALNALEDGERIVLYGEPWTAGESAFAKDAIPAIKKNMHLLHPDIAIFCDNTRDTIKGSVFWDKEPGYVNTSDKEQQKKLAESVKNSIKAWCGVEEFGLSYVRNQPGEYDAIEPFAPRTPGQIISYVSAHDNYTLWDKLKISTVENPDFSKEEGEEELQRLIQMNKMTAGIIFTCLGRPFIQAGEEFGRTKYGEDNSYQSSPELNKLDWERAFLMKELVEYYKGLIAFRKEKELYGKNMDKKAEEIVFLSVEEPLVAFSFEDTLVMYNPLWEKVTVSLPDEKWQLRSDGKAFFEEERKVVEKRVTLEGKSVTILTK